MTLSHYLGVLRRWGIVLVVVGLIGGLVGYLVASRAPERYEADTTLLVGDINETVEGLRAASDLTGTYADLLVTDPFLAAAAQAVGTSPEAVRAAVTVTFDAETRVISVEARHGDPESASAIVTGLATQLQQATDSRGLRRAGEVMVLSPAPVRGALVPSDAALRAVLVAVSAVALTYVAAVLLERRRPVVRDADEAAAAAGRHVLAVLPTVSAATALQAPDPPAPPYRLLAHSLEASGLDGSPVVVVTGVDEQDDGRGVAAAVAVAVAAAGRRVLLLEDPAGDGEGMLLELGDSGGVRATPRRPPGPLRDVLVRRQPGLSADVAARALGSVRHEVDVVVLAAGSVQGSVSAVAWTRAAQVVLLVARLQHTSTEALRDSARVLPSEGSGGLVLTTRAAGTLSGEPRTHARPAPGRTKPVAAGPAASNGRPRIHVAPKQVATDGAASTPAAEGTRQA